jgi:hypothetical protein
MRMRSGVAMLGTALLALSASVSSQTVITLPGVQATAEAGCAQPAHGTSSSLSYDCLNRMMAVTPSTPPPTLGSEPGQRPSNTIGLYNASGLRHRMGPNLGSSVQPYRPKVTYPTPLTH